MTAVPIRNRQIRLLPEMMGAGGATCERGLTRTDTNADCVRDAAGVNTPFLRSAPIES